MKTRFSKIGKYLAASFFFMALMVNVKFSLTDPFVTVGTELIAETTGTTGTNTGTGDGYIIEYGSTYGSIIDEAWPCPCGNGTIFFKSQKCYHKCEIPGNTPCPDLTKKIIQSGCCSSGCGECIK